MISENSRKSEEASTSSASMVVTPMRRLYYLWLNVASYEKSIIVHSNIIVYRSIVAS